MLLIDAIAQITERQIAMSDGDFIYLDDKKKVTKTIVKQAEKLVDDVRCNVLRAERDALIAESDWVIQRHSEELLMGVEPTLNPSEIEAILIYRQDLRDLPQQPNFPDVEFPEFPIEGV